MAERGGALPGFDGSQCTSIARTDRLDDIGASPSIGTIGDSFNAMAESVIGCSRPHRTLHRNPAALLTDGGTLARAR